MRDNTYGHYRSVFNHYDVIGQQRNRIRWEKRKIKAVTPLKVIQGHRGSYQWKAVCDLLLVINSNWRPISCRFGVMAAYCSIFLTFCVIEPTFGGLETTYDVHLRLIGKRVVDFLSVNWTFSLGVTAEALLAKIDRKSSISLQHSQFNPKFQVEGVAPQTFFFSVN